MSGWSYERQTRKDENSREGDGDDRIISRVSVRGRWCYEMDTIEYFIVGIESGKLTMAKDESSDRDKFLRDKLRYKRVVDIKVSGTIYNSPLGLKKTDFTNEAKEKYGLKKTPA